jgi:hypothetical protein
MPTLRGALQFQGGPIRSGSASATIVTCDGTGGPQSEPLPVPRQALSQRSNSEGYAVTGGTDARFSTAVAAAAAMRPTVLSQLILAWRVISRR